MRFTIKNTQSKKLITKRDGIVILLIITAAITALIFHLKKTNGNTAVITVDGQTKATFKLADRFPEVYELDGAVIELRQGKIRIKNSDCPNQICVHTGYISKKGEKIVCLPKKLVIEIE